LKIDGLPCPCIIPESREISVYFRNTTKLRADQNCQVLAIWQTADAGDFVTIGTTIVENSSVRRLEMSSLLKVI